MDLKKTIWKEDYQDKELILKAQIVVLADIIMNVVEMLQSQFQVISCFHTIP